MIEPALALDIAASGMAAELANMNVIAEKLANADTTSAGAPYRTRTAVFEPASLDDDETSFPIGGSFGGGSFGASGRPKAGTRGPGPRVKDWWTAEDAKSYKARTAAIVPG